MQKLVNKPLTCLIGSICLPQKHRFHNVVQRSVATLLMWSNCHTVLWQICSR